MQKFPTRNRQFTSKYYNSEIMLEDRVQYLHYVVGPIKFPL